MSRNRFLSAALLLLLPAGLAAQGASGSHVPGHGMTVVDGPALAFAPITPPGFEPGMMIAVLSGDPGAAQPYTIRLSFPAGYRFPSHWHPGVENLTVLSGTFFLGEGGTENWNDVTTYEAGDYLHIPARSPHYGGVREATVIQLHGVGPFDIILGSPQDN